MDYKGMTREGGRDRTIIVEGLTIHYNLKQKKSPLLPNVCVSVYFCIGF